MTLVGLVVYNLAGYNYFMDSNTRLIFKIATPMLLLISTWVIHKTGDIIYRNIAFAFFAVSLGFLVTYFLGRWASLIPGIVLESVEGWAVSKFAEVVPIVATVIVLAIVFGESLKEPYLVGGNLRKSLSLGLAVLPLSFIQYFVMGGLSVNVAGEVLIGWIPWLLLFSFSNAFMEELIFRGLFLKKLIEVFGERGALLQISFGFAIFHAAILPFMGLEMVVVFLIFMFFAGYSWGYVVQQSGSIWGAALAHAIADILFVIVAFGII
ncbi:MAG: CPBP family intramembrane metalloprotease [Candidatus Thorarchaeota archaeon]|nr:CPBP family intramembrane metalloprotease [Candidatus Thorarchaeota archaeon]